MTKELLEKRLERVSPEKVALVKRALIMPHINPRERFQEMPYWKGEWTDEIAKAVTPFGDGVFDKNLSNRFCNAVNKAPLKRVYYGIRSTGTLPEEFLKALTQWEGVFFYAGRWDIRHPDLTEPLDVLTVRHLRAGLNLLYSHHYRRKNRGIYTSELVLPENKEIREAYKRILAAYESGKKQVKSEQLVRPVEPAGRIQRKLFETDYPVPFR
jgi:hypothetical protein